MKELNQWLEEHKEEMFADLARLIRIDSVRQPAESGMPFGRPAAEAIQLMAELCGKSGLTVRNFDNYVMTAQLGDDEPELGILAHLDVVPAGDGWSVPPFELTRKDGALYGRGVIDDKGPALGALYALKAIMALNVPLSKSVRLIIGSDEENGSSDLEYYAKKEKMPPMLFTPDGDFPVINIEKGMLRTAFSMHIGEEKTPVHVVSLHGGKAVNAVPGTACAEISGLTAETLQDAIDKQPAKGVTFSFVQREGIVSVTARGVGAHASTPEKGVNALTGLLTLLCALPLSSCASTNAIQSLATLFPHGDVFGQTTGLACADDKSGPLTLVFSVCDLENGALSGMTDIRFPTGKTQNQIMTMESAALKRCGFLVKEALGQEPHEVPEESPFVQTLLNVWEQETGEKGHCIAIGGGTYVHNTTGGVAFGPAFEGEEYNMHGADEHVSEETLLTGAKLYAQAILTLCK